MSGTISLSDALKITRRGIYKYESDWRCLVIVRKERQVPVLWDEIKSLMEASSLRIKHARFATRVMHVERGGIIRVAAIEDLTDAYLYAGSSYTHVIWLYEPELKVEKYVAANIRSSVVQPSDCHETFAEW